MINEEYEFFKSWQSSNFNNNSWTLKSHDNFMSLLYSPWFDQFQNSILYFDGKSHSQSKEVNVSYFNIPHMIISRIINRHFPKDCFHFNQHSWKNKSICFKKVNFLWKITHLNFYPFNLKLRFVGRKSGEVHIEFNFLILFTLGAE